MKTIRDLELSYRKVLIRADLNVPLAEDGTVSDPHRIKEFLPTLKYCLEQNAKCIVMSHFGRPGGKRDEKYSLKPVAKALSQAIGVDVTLAPDSVGAEVEEIVKAMKPGQIVLLENLRFREEEAKDHKTFASSLAKLGEVFINDAFATTHRAHASMVAVPMHFQEKGIGFLMQKELDYIDRTLSNPKRPLCVILGGAKISSKFEAFKNISDKAEILIIGGAMANTFLAAGGQQMGKSLYEPALIPKVQELLGFLARRGCKVYLPVDFVVAPSINSKKGLERVTTAYDVPADCMALDIGPATRLLYAEALIHAETILWNGPMGAFEKEEFAEGTHKMVEAVANSHALKVAGGGDTDSAIHTMELAHKFDFISTGGGAFLTLLEGKELPALAALE